MTCSLIVIPQMFTQGEWIIYLFITLCYSVFLVNTIKVIVCSDDFETLAMGQLSKFVMERMEKYFALVSSRVEKQQEVGETLILVRALDRFHRRLQAINTLFQHTDFTL